VGNRYAPKVFAFGEVAYHGPEKVTPVSGTLTINSDGFYKLVGTGAPNSRVVVNPGVSVDILMKDLTLDVGYHGLCPFQISPGAKVHLRLAGNNFLKSASDWAALAAPEGVELTITSAAGDGLLSGSLTTAVAQYGAAIGGNRGEAGGSITINGGTINATGNDAAAIGGGWNGDGGKITINGGEVTAYVSGSSTASIGGKGGVIVGISGGTVTATSNNSIGIGGDDKAIINISGGKVTATGKGAKNAGIGGNTNASIDITGGLITAEAVGSKNLEGDPEGGAGIGGNDGKQKITISGGDVTATSTGEEGGAAIGGGTDSNGGVINISGGKVTATSTGKNGGAGIGGGSDGNGGDITISGGDVTAESTASQGGAGIGGGTDCNNSSGNGGDITISGGNVTATSTGEQGGAGIGGGSTLWESSSTNGSGTIKISGGVVTATVKATGGSYPAAGIGYGSGYDASVGIIDLSGGTIFVLAGYPTVKGSINNTGAIILAPMGLESSGGGTLVSRDLLSYDADTKTITLTSTDLTVPSGKTLTIPRGYTVKENGYKITGTVVDMNEQAFVSLDNGSWAINWGTPIADKVELFNGLYIASGKTLTVPSGKTVIIPSGVTAINDGTIVVEKGGKLTVTGTLKNRGLVVDMNDSGGVTGAGKIDNGAGLGIGGMLALDSGAKTWTATGTAPLPDGFVISEDYTLIISSPDAAAIHGSAVNNGTISLDIGGTLLVYGALTNNGSLDIAGTLDNKGTIDNHGTVADSGTIVNEQDAVINNYELIHVAKSGVLDNYGIINNYKPGRIQIDGTLVNEPDALLYNEDGATIDVADGGVLRNRGTLNNDGVIDVADEGTFENTGVINNGQDGVISGVINNRGGGVINGRLGYKTVVIDHNAGGSVSSTDITQGLVKILSADAVIAEKQMFQSGDSSLREWVITAPAGTDLANVALFFPLPAVASIEPANGSRQNFSNGYVTYTVTVAAGTSLELEDKYQVWLRTQQPSKLLSTDPTRWRFDVHVNDGGSVTFVADAPLVGDFSPESITESLLSVALGGKYLDEKFTLTVGTIPAQFGEAVLRILGTASGIGELEKSLNISRVEWTLDDGSEYFQDGLWMTYEVLSGKAIRSEATPSSADDGGGGGCEVGLWPFIALFAVLCSRRGR
jgi:hypothetical protein